MAKKKKKNPKDNAITEALDQIKQRFGEGAIMRFGEQAQNIETITTGCLSLDLALGKGIPRGRVIEIYGPEASGKTTLAQHMIAEVQKAGGTAAFIDAEHALDPEYAKKIGIDVENLLISQPNFGEQALEILETLVRSNAVDVVVIDSVAALTPRAEIEGDMGDSHMGLQARLMSQALRKLTSIINKTNTIVIFINQIRMKIGVMFGNPETTTGGNALKFYSSVRIEIRRRAQIKKGDKIIGNRVKVKIAKNKVAPPFRRAEFDIMYNEGISAAGDILEVGMKLGVIKKSGHTYKYNDEKLAVGNQATKTYLKDNQDLLKEIRQKILDKLEADRKAEEEEEKATAEANKKQAKKGKK